MKKALFEVPKEKKIRVIVDTDCNNEVDDQYAVAHALMTPKFDVVGITAAHYGNSFGRSTEEQTAEASYQEVLKVLDLMDLTGQIKVFRGCGAKIPDEETFVESDASRFIVEEAMRDDERPLFIVHQGAITNLASACLMEPEIADKLTAIWIGGEAYPEGGFEFNLCNDINAANVIMDSPIELWQVPFNVYSMMKVSFTTLFERVHPYGKIGEYLVENLVRFSGEFIPMLSRMTPTGKSSRAAAAGYPGGESWQLGDSPVVGLLLADNAGHYTVECAPRFNSECGGNPMGWGPNTGRYILRPDNERKIRVYTDIDSHFILEDFYAKIKYYFS